MDILIACVFDMVGWLVGRYIFSLGVDGKDKWIYLTESRCCKFLIAVIVTIKAEVR